MNCTMEQKYASPRVNLFEDSDSIRMEVEMPGVSAEGAEVEVADGLLTLKGTRATRETPGEPCLRERPETGFYRAFKLSDEIDTEAVVAKMDSGLLTLTLNKINKTRNIPIN